jgi:hypothetical protein
METNEPIVTIVKKNIPHNVGQYTFQIIETPNIYEGKILSCNFKIGGDYNDCVSVSIVYDNNQPIYATIPHAMYDEECADNIHLDRGGYVIMIKTLLEHVHQQIPSLMEVEFEDELRIEGATENKIVTPIPLYYFSIAFNGGQTWYERHFHAKLKDPRKYYIYRTKVEQLLHSLELKTNTTYCKFLEVIQLPPEQVANKLEEYYNKSVTFGRFFQIIPFSERKNAVRYWIKPFMDYHLKDIFSNYGWIIRMSQYG